MLTQKNILIVEDEALIGFDLECLIEELDGEVVELCQDVLSAMKAATTLDFDAAILDYDVGGDRVDPVALKLVERGIPFVFSTANAEQIARTPAFKGVPVYTKPISHRHLGNALIDLLSA